MASAERRDYHGANCFNQDFRMSPKPSDQPSPVSKKLESDLTPSNSIDDHTYAKSGSTPHTPNSDRLPNIKWWLHVKTNRVHEANYTYRHLNCWESELGSVYAGFLDDNVKIGGDKSIKHFDPTCIKNNNNMIRSIEASLNNDLHLYSKKKDQEEFYISDGKFMDSEIANILVSEHGKGASSDLESHLMGTEKTRPWWRTSGKDELASLVAQKSLEHIENCDLPHPQTKHFRHRPLYPKAVDHDKTPVSPLNLKAKTHSSGADGFTSETPSSGYSFQDSNTNFSSSQSKESVSSNTERCHTNSENSSSMTELLEALCHSQTRAREAERAAQQAYNEKEHILSLFLRQATQLFAYKQWFHMLQLENLCLQLRNKNQPLLQHIFPCREMHLKKKSHGRTRKRRIGKRKCGIGKFAVAFAVGLGLVGAGLLLGWTMGWMFPSL